MLICITGKSGDGKTTLARILAENLCDVEKIHVDKIHFPIIASKKEKLLEIFGPQIFCKGILNNELLLQDPNKFRIIEELCNDEFYNQLFFSIKKALSCNKIVILEWARLPEIAEIWNKCDLKILIKSDNEEQRFQILRQRHHSGSNDNDFEAPYTITDQNLKERDFYVPDFNRFSYHYVVINNYDGSLFAEAKQIAEEIASKI